MVTALFIWLMVGIVWTLWKMWEERRIKERRIFEGCETCTVGVFYGLQVSGYYEAYCRSALLGLDDNLHYKTRSVRLKGSEKYPEWCPFKNVIIKGGAIKLNGYQESRTNN